jgi:response regulator NasT
MTTSGKRDGGVEENTVFAAAVSTGTDEALAAGEDRGGAADGRTVVVIGGPESELVTRATEQGLEPLLAREEQLDEAVSLALKQAAELERLRSLTARLAQVERAKGILMERHKMSERDAHERMRRHARNLNVKLAAVAEAVEDSYLLVPAEE